MNVVSAAASKAAIVIPPIVITALSTSAAMHVTPESAVVKPVPHSHVKLPTVSVHAALGSQLSEPSVQKPEAGAGVAGVAAVVVAASGKAFDVTGIDA